MTDIQAKALAFIMGFERGVTAKELAKHLWPDDPAWSKRTAGRGASRHTGAVGATLPLRAGRVLAKLADQRLIERREKPWDSRWVVR